MTQRIFSSLLLVLTLHLAYAQIPAGYYADSKGTKGSGLKTALHHIIKNPDVSSYSSLKELFQQTDRRPDGKVWDMYSRENNMSFSGGGYNREHSFPKSWFGGKIPPMYSDLFHIYPTTIAVNSARWHYPYGENNGEEKSFDDGFCKVGKCTTPGYSGIVFEPADEYKGDFARTYFYMVTCYEDKVAGWKYINGNETQGEVVMLDHTSYPAFSQWALDMLLRWAQEDPVSQKEIDRNNAVHRIQHNRNPYIDYPGLEQYVWGSMTSTEFDPDNYDSNIKPGPQPVYPKAPEFNPASGFVAAGTEVSISTATPGASIHYTINEGQEKSAPSPVKVTINEKTTISAYAELNEVRSQSVSATYLLEGDIPAEGKVYQIITDPQKVMNGASVLIVSVPEKMAMGEQNGDIRGKAAVTITNGLISDQVNTAGCPYALVLGGSNGNWTLFDETDHTYLALTKNSNKLHAIGESSSTEAHWDININSDGTASITSKAFPKRTIQYNINSPRFACYESKQGSVSLFGLITQSGIANINRNAKGHVMVYDLNGKLIRSSQTAEKALNRLPQGFYIVNGEKILVK